MAALRLLAAGALGMGIAACSGGAAVVRPDVTAAAAAALRGKASWYGPGFAGRSTASGERFDPGGFTAAHRTLPLGTVVRVVREDTRQWVVVRINDRGPYARGRVVDLSEAAAREIEMIERGHVPVYIEVLSRPPGRQGPDAGMGGGS